MAKKTGFILHYDMLDNLKLLGNDSIVVEVITALCKHDQGKEIGTLSPQAQFAFNAYTPTLNKAKKRWETNVINSGGEIEPTESQSKAEHKPTNSQTQANDEPTESQSGFLDGVIVTDIVTENANETEKENVYFSFSETVLPKEEPASPEPIPEKLPETKEDVGRIFEEVRKFWNTHKPLPECRDLFIPGTEIENVLRTLQQYTLAEIKNAIENYHWHKTRECGEGYVDAPPFGRIYGFLKTGVASYFDDATFKAQYKKQGGLSGSKK